MISIIDYGRGNLFSIGQALAKLGAEYAVITDPREIRKAHKIVLPGVGAFGDAMTTLAARGFVEPIRAASLSGVPLLGICLGMQLLADESYEFGHHKGFGLIPGRVMRLPEGDEVRIPNVGWRQLKPHTQNGILNDLKTEAVCYFVHSFAPVVSNPEDCKATISINGKDVVAVIQRRNTVGYQFHPEKSGAIGLELMRRFLDLI